MLESQDVVRRSVVSHSVALLRLQKLVGVPLAHSQVLAVLHFCLRSTRSHVEQGLRLERLLLRDFWFSGSKLQSHCCVHAELVSLLVPQFSPSLGDFADVWSLELVNFVPLVLVLPSPVREHLQVLFRGSLVRSQALYLLHSSARSMYFCSSTIVRHFELHSATIYSKSQDVYSELLYF